jgi:hypothetical protein
VKAPEFPRARFDRVRGISAGETDLLEAQFERSDIGVQASLLNFYTSRSDSMLREYAAELRDAGHFDAVREAPSEPGEPGNADDEGDSTSRASQAPESATGDDEPPED